MNLGKTRWLPEPGQKVFIVVKSAGAQGNQDSVIPSISADGRYVAFSSTATNLISGDTNAKSDIFVRDTCAGVPSGCTPTTTRVSVAAGGVQGNGDSLLPSLSANGQFVGFTSTASNLVSGDTNGVPDLFMRTNP